MCVVDGRAYRVAQLMTCVQRRVFTIPCTESFHLIPNKAYFGMIMMRRDAASKMGVVDRCGQYVTLDAV